MLDLEGVEPQRFADVAVDAIVRSQSDWARKNRRPRALSAREALLALAFETHIVWIVGCDLQSGKDVSEGDWDRFIAALRRIDAIAQEAAG
jgi:hypothetical protein